MNSYKNIEEYRRKKKIKRLLIKGLIVAAIFGILLLLLYVLQEYKGSELREIITQEESAEQNMFPLVVKNEQLLDLHNFGNDIALLSKSNLISYSFSGKKNETYIHGYTNPVVREGTKRLLTYDRGGYKFRVDSPGGKIGEIVVDSTIICGAIAPDGSVAIVMNYKNHMPVVKVYDEGLRMKWQYFSAEDFTSVAFADSGTKLLLGTVGVEEGILSAELHELDVNRTEDATVTVVPDILPLGVGYGVDGSKVVVGKDSFVSVNGSTGKQTVFRYQGDLQFFVMLSDRVVLVNKNLFNSYSTLSVVSSNGKLIAQADIQDDILDLYSDGGRIVLLGKKAAYNYDVGLMLLNEIPLEQTFSKIIYSGENLFVLGNGTVEKHRID